VSVLSGRNRTGRLNSDTRRLIHRGLSRRYRMTEGWEGESRPSAGDLIESNRWNADTLRPVDATSKPAASCSTLVLLNCFRVQFLRVADGAAIALSFACF